MIDELDVFRRKILSGCYKADTSGDEFLVESPTREMEKMIKKMAEKEEIYVGRVKGTTMGRAIPLRGFSEKGRRIYCPRGELLSCYRMESC